MRLVLWAGVALGLSVLTGLRPRFPQSRLRRFRSRRSDDQVLDFARLLAICLAAGLPLPAALAHSLTETREPLRTEVADLLRRARNRGLAASLIETSGVLGGLARSLARAQVTGAPVAEAVSGFVQARRSAMHARQLERARTLSVTLIVPVALLLLPGFLALVVGPIVVEHVGGLVGTVMNP